MAFVDQITVLVDVVVEERNELVPGVAPERDYRPVSVAPFLLEPSRAASALNVV
jgi:hypothetical protein